MNDTLKQQLIAWRRDFHRHPEQGFLEMRTASLIAAELSALGYQLRLGREVMNENAMMGRPSASATANHLQWAQAHGANAEFLPYFQEGFTGIVAEYDTGKKGATTAFRVDMDALPILESADEHHFPQQQGFRSINEGSMHACGHDGHSAMGLALAHLIMQHKSELCGKLRLIFQPAEEGVRGAKSMVEAGVVDDVDYFIAVHLGTGVPQQHFVAASQGFLATSKLDITFKGIASHAGARPQDGKNALLAAANAALNLHAISRHSEGASRINVGELHAGSGRNIIANHASLKIETRGNNAQINEYIETQARNIIEGAAKMYDVQYDIQLAGSAIHCQPSPALAKRLAEIAKTSPYFTHIIEQEDSALGSEDATYFIQRVQHQGGQATYCIIGTTLAANHHHECFDIQEDSLIAGADILFRAATALNKSA